MKYIYVSGPISHGDVVMNVRAAVDIAEELLRHGFVPIVPHLSFIWHLISPRTHEYWMKYDKELLQLCDAVLRIPGHSPGADQEAVWANELFGIPVFDSIFKLREARDRAQMQRLD